MTPSDIDPEEIEDMLTEMREHLIADHVVRVTNQEEMTSIVAETFKVLRMTGDSLVYLAMLLRRIPDSHTTVSDALTDIASMLYGAIPETPEEEA